MLRVKSKVLIFLLFFFCNSVIAKPNKFLDGLEIGISEKGVNFNLINNISRKNQITIGLHNFVGNISNLEHDLSEPVPIFYSSKGFQVSFKRFFTGNNKESGFFKKFGLELSSLKASSTIDLNSQIYDLGALTVTCRTCGNVKIETDNDSYKFIPSFSLGWQKKINKNFNFSISAGIQYFEMPGVKLLSSNSENQPPYVQTKINSIIQHANQELDKYGNIIPTILITSNLIF